MKLVHCLYLIFLISSMSTPSSAIVDNQILVQNYESLNSINFDSSEILPFGDGTLLQAFYWLTPDNGEWWSMLEDKVPEFRNAGFDAIWGPPMVKTKEGNIPSGGYEPYDFYDLGEFDQQGRVRTRFGTRTQLESFISSANLNDLAVIADVVINHNRGGEIEWNPIADTFTETNFMNVASGKFLRNYTSYHPCEEEYADNYRFADFPDLCHANPYVHDELIEWGKWLRDEIGYDGWRFDVAIGINATMIKDWMTEVGGSKFSIAEYWGNSFSDLINYLDATDNTLGAFDFYLMYALRWMVLNDGAYDLRKLASEGILGTGRSDQAITFVVNHDTVRQDTVNIPRERHLPYSYILTHEGYPTVFWDDYFDENLQPHLIPLIQAREKYINGDVKTLFANSDLYIMERTGDPGLIYALNDNPTFSRQATVNTKWVDTILYEQTEKVEEISIGSDGTVTIEVPPRSYLILTEDKPIFNVTTMIERDEFTQLNKIDVADIEIDGLFDYGWGYPLMIDLLGDSAGNQRDLENGYIKHDNENLYIGFTYGQDILNEESTHYSIAIDTMAGGSFEDPFRDNIKFLGGVKADYLYNLITDPTDPWNEVATGEKYVYNQALEAWENGVSLTTDQFHSDALMGFTEIQIPLEDIELTDDTEIRIKIFSTADNDVNAIDSMPHDSTILVADGNSWLEFSEKLIIEINDDSSSSSKKSIFHFYSIIPIMAIVILLRRTKLR